MLPIVAFTVFIVLLLILDLGVFHRKGHKVSVKEALWWSCFWIALALLFGVGVYYFKGYETALKYYAGYLIEKSLSVDNLFVFLLVFKCFSIPDKYQHRVLFWGIIGALIMRGLFIWLGVALVQQFSWVLYIFGAFLVYTGIQLARNKDLEIDPQNNIIMKLFEKIMPVTRELHEDKFFIKRGAQYVATPMFLALLSIETTDVIFAFDSIPAIFGITLDPFVIYTSNVFAILGLRSLYFALSALMGMFEYLHYGLAVILVFIGIKMLIEPFLHIPIGISIAVLAFVLIGSMLISYFTAEKKG